MRVFLLLALLCHDFYDETVPGLGYYENDKTPAIENQQFFNDIVDYPDEFEPDPQPYVFEENLVV